MAPCVSGDPRPPRLGVGVHPCRGGVETALPLCVMRPVRGRVARARTAAGGIARSEQAARLARPKGALLTPKEPDSAAGGTVACARSCRCPGVADAVVCASRLLLR